MSNISKYTPEQFADHMANSCSIEELEEIKHEIEAQISKKQWEERRKVKKTREQLLKEFYRFGYIVPPGSKFWKIGGPVKSAGAYGMEVGAYVHSCHVDTTDLKVLLVVDGNEHFVESYSDFWLSDPVIA